MKYCYVDAEFNGTSEPALNVVSIASVQVESGVVVSEESFWTHGKQYSAARDFYLNLASEGYTFVSFVAEAEVRTFKTLCPEFDWTTVLWIDLSLEYRCLLNHNHDLAYGEQYIKGKIITTTPPPNKWDRDESEEDSELHHKPEHSLAAATYKLLKIKIDTDEKNRMRDIIIHSDAEEIEANKDAILSYNLSDIKNLRDLSKAVVSQFSAKGLSFSVWLNHALSRGNYAALTGYMISRGYPVNMSKVEKLTQNVGEIIKLCAEDCLTHGVDAFRWDKKKLRYVKTEKHIRAWVMEQNNPSWLLTDKNSLSLSKKAFEKWYTSQSPGFAGAYCRYLKTLQSLNGFLPGTKNKFTDSVGRDNRVRPHFGIYGAQSSRSQPKAAAYIPLKAHWMRTLIEPSGRNAIIGFDYNSQEFLLAAIQSNDLKMQEDYASGDVYLAFARAAGLVPADATKSSHAKERNFCKSCVLGMSYEMGAKGLAAKMTADTGDLVTEETAQEYIEIFSEAYPDYAEWKKETLRVYRDEGCLSLPDGWIMWGDNDNWRSTINMPIQGMGAVIMRRAVKLCHERDIPIIFTLHDALYAEIEYCNFNKMRLFRDTMIEAFHDVMKPYQSAVPIKVEGMAWSKNYSQFKVKKVDDIDLLPAYFDGKCVDGLRMFSRYLE